MWVKPPMHPAYWCRRRLAPLTSYFWDGEGWSQVRQAAGSTEPMQVVLYSGSDSDGHQVSMDNLVIESAAQ